MKYRIIKNGLGQYIVQRCSYGANLVWDEYLYWFSPKYTFEEATKIFEDIKKQCEAERLRKTFEVIEEFEV